MEYIKTQPEVEGNRVNIYTEHTVIRLKNFTYRLRPDLLVTYSTYTPQSPMSLLGYKYTHQAWTYTYKYTPQFPMGLVICKYSTRFPFYLLMYKYTPPSSLFLFMYKYIPGLLCVWLCTNTLPSLPCSGYGNTRFILLFVWV